MYYTLLGTCNVKSFVTYGSRMTPGKSCCAFSQRHLRRVLEMRRVGDRMMIRLDSVILFCFSCNNCNSGLGKMLELSFNMGEWELWVLTCI